MAGAVMLTQRASSACAIAGGAEFRRIGKGSGRAAGRLDDRHVLQRPELHMFADRQDRSPPGDGQRIAGFQELVQRLALRRRPSRSIRGRACRRSAPRDSRQGRNAASSSCAIGKRGEAGRLQRDADDALLAGISEVAVDGRTRHTHRIGDLALGHAVFVVEPAGPDIGIVAIAQRHRHRVLSVCRSCLLRPCGAKAVLGVMKRFPGCSSRVRLVPGREDGSNVIGLQPHFRKPRRAITAFGRHMIAPSWDGHSLKPAAGTERQFLQNDGAGRRAGIEHAERALAETAGASDLGHQVRASNHARSPRPRRER